VRVARIAASLTVSLVLSQAPVARAWAEGEPPPEPPTPAQPPPRHFGGQREVGVGGTLGFTNGAGAALDLAWGPFALWLTGGYFPVLVFGNEKIGRAMTVDGYSSGLIIANAVVMPWHPGSRVDIGLLAGYAYDTLLGHGGGGGVGVTLDLTRDLAMQFSLEILGFPRAQDNLTAAGYPGDRDAVLPWMQGGGNVGLLFYP
jgi:hypothetical protein